MSFVRLLSAGSLLMIGAIVGSSLAVAGGVPVPPASYHGQVFVDGEPAPAGVEVVARINGEARGRIVTDTNGTFGGPDALDKKLRVNGSAADEGEAVQFVVGSSIAETTVPWSSGASRALNIRTQSLVRGDVTGDGVVDIRDAIRLGRGWGCTRETACYRAGADLNNDGVLDVFDAVILGRYWGSRAL